MKAISIILLGAICLAACATEGVRYTSSSRQEVGDKYVANLFRLLNSHCNSRYSNRQQMMNALGMEAGLDKVRHGRSVEFHVHRGDVDYAIIPEKDGCTVDMLDASKSATSLINYRYLYKELNASGYKPYGGIIRRGTAVDRQYVSSDGLNMLLFIPGPESHERYISLHVELFDRHSSSLFPRTGVYVRRELARPLAEYFRQQKVLERNGEHGRIDPGKNAARYMLPALERSLGDGRWGLGSELETLALVAGNSANIANDPVVVGHFIQAASLYEADYGEYKRIGYTNEVDDSDDHGFSNYSKVAAALLSFGEFHRSVNFYTFAWRAGGARLKADDIAGYARFAADYSAALYGSGEVADAKKWWRNANSIDPDKTSAPTKYLGRRPLRLAEDDSFFVKDSDKEQSVGTKDGRITITIRQVRKAFRNARYIKYFDLTLSSNEGKYTIAGLRTRSMRYPRWMVIHPLESGIDRMSFSKGRPVKLTEWAVGAANPVNPFIHSGTSEGEPFDTMQVQFVLKSKENRMRTITFEIPFDM